MRLPSSRSARVVRRFISFSSVDGPTYPPLDYRTLPAFFREEVMGRYGERPALICRKEHPMAYGGPPSRNMGVSGYLAWDFREFDRHIGAVARGLISLGVKKGERVGVIMGNNSAYALLQLACMNIGAILVPLNPAYRLHELVDVLNLVRVTHLFVVPRIRKSRYIHALSAAFPDLRYSTPGNIKTASLPSLRNLVVANDVSNPKEYLDELGDTKCVIDFREMLVWSEDCPEQRYLSKATNSHHFDEVISLQFTSGTTGRPKAASLTHLNLLNNALSTARCLRLTSDDILSYPVGFARLVLGNLTAWSHGACVVYPSSEYNPRNVLDAIAENRCTTLNGVPTHYLGVLSEVQRRKEAREDIDVTYLRTGIVGGTSVPIDLMHQLISKLNLVGITTAYGMTETSPVSFQTTPEDPIAKRVETVGRVQPHVRAKVIDPEGNTVPVGTPGEVCVAGYLLQKEYWEDEEQTRKAMHPDPQDPSTVWMHTGDEGIMDENGYMRIVGRTKDIIVRGGENLFPVQIENVLTAHPSIREAAAVSVQDPVFGEVVGAWIVLESGATMTREEVRGLVSEGMNPQNSPAWVWFTGEPGVAQELPKTASGKVMKHLLREWSKELSRKGVGKLT